MNRVLLASICIALSFVVGGFWPTFLLIFVFSLLLKSREILVFAIYLSFFNMVSAESAPFWGGLGGALFAIFIYMAKGMWARTLPTIKLDVLFFGVAYVAILVISYLTDSKGSEFERTAIKSLTQQSIAVFLLIFFFGLSEIHKRYVRENLSSHIFTFIIIYTVFFFSVDLAIASERRFGGALGAQAFAFILTVFMCHLSFTEKNFYKCVTILAITVITGSRTYLAIQIVLILILLFQTQKNLYKRTIYSSIGIACIVAAIASAPLVSKRLDYYDKDFAGSLFGRVSNYEKSIEMILSNPMTGNGVGSMVRVLEDWIPEFYQYYLEHGDTTIMHNEFLRILTEVGAVGFLCFGIFLYLITGGRNRNTGPYLIVFLTGSLLENTLALYSGPFVAFAILISVTNRNIKSRN